MRRLSNEDELLDAALADPQLEGFAMFDVDLSLVRDPSSGGPAFPELGDRYTPLWTLRSNMGVAHKREADAERTTQARDHDRRVEEYASRVARGLSVFGNDDPTDEGEEPTPNQHDFWGGCPPTVSGQLPRSPSQGGRVRVYCDDDA